jgi:hypothetical protein
MTSDLKNILNLISDCIYFNHPIVLDIRWQFHVSLSKIDNFDPWESREAWENTVKSYRYTIFSFLKSFFSKSEFRKNIIVVLEYELMGLKEKEENV